MQLTEIAKNYPTDKEFEHNYYDRVYQNLFEPIQNSVTKLCEIGVKGLWGERGWVDGNSLRVWRDFFPNAQLLGLDIAPFDDTDLGPRVTVEYIDQSKRDLVVERSNSMSNYDIIIDDGSHVMLDQQITLAHFFKSLKSGGIFICEDLHTSLEVEMPDKNAIWGWGIPGKTNTLQMLKDFISTGKITSDYLDEEEANYLENTIASIEIWDEVPSGITSVIRKK